MSMPRATPLAAAVDPRAPPWRPAPQLLRSRKRLTRRPRRTIMGYRTLADCVADLERTGRLVAIDSEIDPRLEAAAIQRRVYEAGGPAVLFKRLKGTPFPAVGNLFGTRERTHF